jgi:hypothetical protein
MKKITSVLASVLAAALALSLTACGVESTSSDSKEAWDNANAPFRLVEGFQANFSSLPMGGQIATKPWTDSYWPTYEGGIAARWAANAGPSVFDIEKRPTKEELATTETLELESMSPAEKYDLLIGEYEYPLTSYEIGRTNPDAPRWEGLCHGWAPASYNFLEPKPVVMTSVDGINIPFSTSDTKALLTFAHQYNRTSGNEKFLGLRCNDDLSADPDAGDSAKCKGVNPGSLHIALTNMIGIRKEAFVADITRSAEVWNHPFYGFSSTIVDENVEISEKAAAGTVKVVRIKTVVDYVVEIQPHATPIADQDVGQLQTKTYIYTLELNGGGDIIGGEWETSDRPDFIWSQTAPEFTGFFSKLGDLYESSIK